MRLGHGKDKLVQEVELGGQPMVNKYYPYQASWLSVHFMNGVCHPDLRIQMKIGTVPESRPWQTLLVAGSGYWLST